MRSNQKENLEEFEVVYLKVCAHKFVARACKGMVFVCWGVACANVASACRIDAWV